MMASVQQTNIASGLHYGRTIYLAACALFTVMQILGGPARGGGGGRGEGPPGGFNGIHILTSM